MLIGGGITFGSGITIGNDYVTNGLTLNLDASNSLSYSGSGSIWTDTAQGLTFNSSGTQTPFTTQSGAASFQFNGSGTWVCSTNYNLVPLGGDCTVILWLYDVGHTTRHTVFQKNGTSYASYEQELAMTWEPAPTMSWYSRYNQYDYANTGSIPTNSWFMLAIKMSTGLTSDPRTGFYSLNGGAWTNAYSVRSTTPITPAADIVVGGGYAGTVENGYVGRVMCYNRMLSDAEILRNFDATRGTYGI